MKKKEEQNQKLYELGKEIENTKEKNNILREKIDELVKEGDIQLEKMNGLIKKINNIIGLMNKASRKEGR